MRITRWGEYGIHSSVFIANEHRKGNEVVNSADIAEALNIAVDYAQQILSRLKNGNIIQSVRGPHGGYKLALPSEKITLRDIILATEGETFEIMCEKTPLEDNCGGTVSCSLKDIWQQLHLHVDTFLTKITLADLVKRSKSNKEFVQIGK